MRKFWDRITKSRKRRRRLELDEQLIAEIRRYYEDIEALPPRGYDSIGEYFEEALERHRHPPNVAGL